MSARNVFNLYRALNHVYPLTTKWHGALVKLTEVILSEEDIKKNALDTGSPITNKEVYKSALQFLNSSSETSSTKNTVFQTKDTSFTNKSGNIHFFKNKRELHVTCCDGSVIIVKKLKVSGKSVTALDFYNGFLAKRPKSEWNFES